MSDDIKALGRAKGGVARKEKLSPDRRSEIARNAAIARHAQNRQLEAIRKGNFKEDFGFDAECYVLNDQAKTAVISQRGMAVSIGLKSDGGTAFQRFIQGKSMSSALDSELLEKIRNPLIFNANMPGSGLPPSVVHGYDVTILIDICKAIIQLESDGGLQSNQMSLAKQAHIILNASAKAGIRGLVYALSGYDASKEEVIAAFKAFVQEEAKKYEKEFPTELYLAWARLYEIVAPERGRSWKHKHLTVDHVYFPLAKSNGKLLSLLREARESSGGQKKLHQFLNEVGSRALRMHLGRVLEMAESSATKDIYERKIAERFGGQGVLELETV